MTNHFHAALASLVAALLVAVAIPPAHAGQRPAERILERAVRLLPDRPRVPIRFIDPELAPDPAAIRPLDAFVVREPNGELRQVIYLNRRSRVVENALAGEDLDVAVLAAIIRHELEHLRGGSEREARQVERLFFQRLMFAGEVPMTAGLAYLVQLQQHNLRHEAR